MRDQGSTSGRRTTGREPRVVVRCFPPADREFATHVRGLVDRSWETARDAHGLLVTVTSKLNDRYPQATIHLRDELAELGAEAWSTWYVYRDGRAA